MKIHTTESIFCCSCGERIWRNAYVIPIDSTDMVYCLACVKKNFKRKVSEVVIDEDKSKM